MTTAKDKTLIPWGTVDVWVFRVGPWTSGGSKRLEPGSDEHARALAEYRSTGAIAGCYIVPPNDDPWADSDCYGGPSVEEIDWTGLDLPYLT
jgi:hypothetical protein